MHVLTTATFAQRRNWPFKLASCVSARLHDISRARCAKHIITILASEGRSLSVVAQEHASAVSQLEQSAA